MTEERSLRDKSDGTREHVKASLESKALGTRTRTRTRTRTGVALS